ncbi:hypothetical protein TNCV_3077001 [Trichonephila clavipes]|nr:hypothetical protein TNCV_3077001 [Trichonephila clavipes]
MLRRLVGTTAPGHQRLFNSGMKVSNHGSISITIDCNVVPSSFLKKDSTKRHKAHRKQSSFSGCNGVLMATLVD